MVVVEVLGGLGNQMFQYAFAKSLSALGEEVYLDLSGFQKYKLHSGYMLNKFPVTLKEMNVKPIHRTLIGRGMKKLKILPSKYVLEKGLEVVDYGPLLKEGKDRYFIGYFQSESFFSKIEKDIREDFRFSPFQTASSLNAMSFITSKKNVVSLHVRRGDFLKAKNSSIFRSLTDTYYKKAIMTLSGQVKDDLSFVVFSDDPNWVRENLKLDGEVYYQEGNFGEYAIEDMALMSKCHHHIIANSTFSWWGAWLNDRTDKKVVSPGRWFHLDDLNRNSINPEKWIKIFDE